jgi:hypothetical protein
MYNLFLDDNRQPNAFLKDIRTWVIVRNYNEFVKTIKERGLPDFISYDHDLSWEHYPLSELKEDLKRYGTFSPAREIPYNTFKEKTGYDAAKWLIEYCQEKELQLPEFQVHSMNPVGAENIRKLLEGFKNHQKKNENE